MMLESEGYTVTAAQDGAEASRVMGTKPFDLVITDLLMPERDGLEFITEIRKKYPSVKIIAMSGGGHVARESYLKIAKSFGAHFLLEKPFTQAIVIAAVNTVRNAP